jgi:glycosyltransferase involved in cell wall biosynthesis
MFLIRSLDAGGAERQLVTLAAGLAGRGHAIRIVTCYAPGALAHGLEERHVSHVSLGQSSAWNLLRPLSRLRREVQRWRPDVLHGYMPTSNLLSTFAVSARGPRLVWGVRASGIEWNAYRPLVRATFGMTRLLASRPDLIIANSEAGRSFHVAHGYPGHRIVVIPNGIDVERFRPDATARATVRAAWGVAPESTVIGVAARLDPMKDHATLLHAMAGSRATLPNVVLVCAGAGSSAMRQELEALGRALDVADRVRWFDAGGPVEQFYNACDVHTSASAFGEGFSNAVAEAMACGVPCVVTDVGDSSLLVGDTGIVVPPRSPEALADGWRRMLSGDHRHLGERARARIVLEYSASLLVTRSEDALRSITSRALHVP